MTDLKQARALLALGSNHMRQIANAWLEHQRKRRTRPDAYRWQRPDAGRWRRFDPRFQRSTFGRKAYNPDQPRAPAGSSEGGQWTGDGGTPVRLATADKIPLGRATRIAVALQIAKRLIEVFRKENFLQDFFGRKVGTVAVTSIDDKYVFGFNSGISEFSGQYTELDQAAANELRDKMLEQYPDVMRTNNIGQWPNDALFHAETTVLLRAARENGGALVGKTLVIFVDSEMCRSCNTLLPYVGLELGNPTVTFVDPRGSILTMRNGSWIE